MSPHQSDLFATMPAAADKTATILGVARLLAPRIDRGETIERSGLSQVMTDAFGGTDATGAWSMRDAYDALEAAQVLAIRDGSNAGWRPDSTRADGLSGLERLLAALPTQTYRSEEQIARQQMA